MHVSVAPETGVMWAAHKRTRNPVQVQEKEEDREKAERANKQQQPTLRQNTCSLEPVRSPLFRDFLPTAA